MPSATTAASSTSFPSEVATAPPRSALPVIAPAICTSCRRAKTASPCCTPTRSAPTRGQARHHRHPARIRRPQTPANGRLLVLLTDSARSLQRGGFQPSGAFSATFPDARGCAWPPRNSWAATPRPSAGSARPATSEQSRRAGAPPPLPQNGSPFRRKCPSIRAPQLDRMTGLWRPQSISPKIAQHLSNASSGESFIDRPHTRLLPADHLPCQATPSDAT
jgi:hypothetical protein